MIGQVFHRRIPRDASRARPVGGICGL